MGPQYGPLRIKGRQLEPRKQIDRYIYIRISDHINIYDIICIYVCAYIYIFPKYVLVLYWGVQY